MVCPNRLFAVEVDRSVARPFSGLSPLMQQVLSAIGAMPTAGVYLGIWDEVKIMEEVEGQRFDYRFDFIINPIPSQDTSSPAVVNSHTREQTKRGARSIRAPQRKTCVISRREEGLPAPMTL